MPQFARGAGKGALAEDEGGQSHPAATPGARATAPHPTHPMASPPSGHTPFYFPLARHGARLS